METPAAISFNPLTNALVPDVRRFPHRFVSVRELMLQDTYRFRTQFFWIWIKMQGKLTFERYFESWTMIAYLSYAWSIDMREFQLRSGSEWLDPGIRNYLQTNFSCIFFFLGLFLVSLGHLGLHTKIVEFGPELSIAFLHDDHRLDRWFWSSRVILSPD